LVKGQWRKCQQENIVCIFSHPSPLREGPEWEEFCRVKILLHVCHQNPQLLTENGTIPWSTLYSQHLMEINADANDLLGSPIDAENEIFDEDDGESIEDDEQYEFRPDWMYLAEMGPNPRFDCSSDLGSRDMDRNHDWINDPRQRYSDMMLTDIDTFVDRNSRVNTEKTNIIVDYKTLNNN
jgi:hypothetical protein